MSGTPLDKPIFRKLGEAADRLGVEAYVVGGYVRDYFLHRPCTDIDVVVVGSGIELAKEIARQVKTNVSIFKSFGTAMLRCDGWEVEFVGARKESYRSDSRKPIVENGTLEDDQLRRDFTINAMAFCLNGDRFGELVDPFDGMADLAKCTIRTPCDPDVTFSDDPLRMIRAVRFATQLGFRIENETFDAIGRNAARLKIVSQERIVTELNKIMMAEVPSIGWELFDATGLLEYILPQLKALKGVERRAGKAHKDNFVHTMRVLDNLARKSDKLWLRWGALLHDIAKSQTKSFDPIQGWTFHGHEFLGSKMVATIFRQMKLPLNEHLKYVQKIVLLHMRPIALTQEEITDSAIRRLLFEAGDDIDDLMMLCAADITSGNDDKVKRYLENFEIVKTKMAEVEEKDRIRNFQPPISGDYIMQTYGVEPCRELGVIKNAIKDAILEGTIPNEFEPARLMMEQMAAEFGWTKVE